MSASPRARSRIRASRLPVWFGDNGPENEIVISTRIRLARNLNNHPFPSHASPGERKKVFDTVQRALPSRAGNHALYTVNFSNLSPVDQRFLVERRIASPDLLSLEGDRGVAFDNASGIAVMINEEDHLRLQCLVPGCDPLVSWNALDSLDDTLGRELDYAFDRRRGYLTCCPTNSGTGLRVSFLVHLPALILTKSLDAVLLGATQLGVAVRGFFGEHSEVVGGYFQLSNQATMGSSEREFIANAEKTVAEIVGCERRARDRLLKEARLELEDKIHRAFGILSFARMLSVAEFLNCASALRLGIDTGIFDKVSRERLNSATLEVLPAHLHRFANRELDATATATLRAERVRTLLCGKKSVPRAVRKTPTTRS
jgi:protein arginine kinase